ncbi:MAG: hypothetical protein AB2705_03740 [Candidatus Thiodiazotropha sp.]
MAGNPLERIETPGERTGILRFSVRGTINNRRLIQIRPINLEDEA